jgi:hypothetical protein
LLTSLISTSRRMSLLARLNASHYDCPRISFELKEDEQFLCLAEIVTLACVAKHAWHSPIFEGLPFFLDMKECINAFQYIEI